MAIADARDVVASDQAATLDIDLGAAGTALDLTARDWPHHLGDALARAFGDTATGIDWSNLLEVVGSRARGLADDGAVSLLLVPTASDVAPVAVGAVFVHDPVHCELAQWQQRLDSAGWQTMSTAGPGSPAVRARRTMPIPGVAALVLSEHLLVIPMTSALLTVTFHVVDADYVADCPIR